MGEGASVGGTVWPLSFALICRVTRLTNKHSGYLTSTTHRRRVVRSFAAVSDVDRCLVASLFQRFTILCCSALVL
jgi:hypothetical protein